MSIGQTNDEVSYVQKHIDTIDIMSQACFKNSESKGFWEERHNAPANLIPIIKASMIALQHSELSEKLEAVRKNPNAPSEHCPEITIEEEELADEFIRLADYAAGWKLRLGFAIVQKMVFNATRPHKHGKKF